MLQSNEHRLNRLAYQCVCVFLQYSILSGCVFKALQFIKMFCRIITFCQDVLLDLYVPSGCFHGSLFAKSAVLHTLTLRTLSYSF